MQEILIKLETEQEKQAFFAIIDTALKSKGIEIYDAVAAVQKKIVSPVQPHPK